MNFLNKNALPPELRELTPEQMTAFVEEAKKKDTEAAALKAAKEAAEAAATAASTAVAAGQDAVARLKKLQEAGVVDDKGNPITKTAGAGEGAGAGAGTGDDLTDFLTDPGKAMDARMAPTQMLAAIAAMNSARLMAENQVAGLPGREGQIARKVWKKYGSEIQALVDREPMMRRCDPSVWMMALTHVQGTKFGDILKDIQTEGDGFFTEGVGQSGGGMPGAGDKKDDALTPEEEKIIKRYGITKEGYLKQKKSMTFSAV